MRKTKQLWVISTLIIIASCIPLSPSRNVSGTVSGTVSETANCTNTPVQDVSFRQLIQPAFAKDFAGKLVRFEAEFVGIINTVADLPSEYTQDYIRIMLTDNSNTNSYGNVVIPKDKSGPVFNLKPLQTIKIVACTVLVTETTIAGGQSNELLLVVNSINQ